MRKTRSISGELIGGYAVFVVLFIIETFAAVLISFAVTSRFDLTKTNPYLYVNSDGTVNDTSYWENLGGWIECLDENYCIIETIGTKQDEIKQYSSEQLFEYLSVENEVETDTSASVYRGFIKAVQNGGEIQYYLMKINRNTITFSYEYNLSSQNTVMQNYAILFFGCMLLFFLIDSAAIGLFLTRRIQKPITKIIDGMDQVKQGEKNIRLDFKAPKEFAKIQDDFNQMMDELESVEKEKEQLQQQQNRMLLELSHDIKTPVATIKSYANVLKDNLASEDKLEEYYALIETKADRVNDLVNAMFLMLKYDNAEYQLTLEQTDLSELLRRISADLYDVLTRNGKKFDIQIPENALMADVDEKEFTRVIENLLYNASKYNVSGTGSVITLEKDGDDAVIYVKDDGAAIEEEMRAHLFEPFARGDSARLSTGGTGLGLAIAKKIMEKHGGTLSYDYADGWNQFIVILPPSASA